MSSYNKAVLILCHCLPDLSVIMKDERLDNLALFTDTYHYSANKDIYPNIEIVDIPHEKKKELNQLATEQLNTFTLASKDRHCIMEELKFEGSYIWYYHRYRIYFKLRQLHYSIQLINELLEKYSFVTVFSNDEYLKKIFDNVSTVDLQLYNNSCSVKPSKLKMLSVGWSLVKNGIKSSFTSSGNGEHLIVVNSEHGTASKTEHGTYNRYYANLLKTGDPKKFSILDLSIMPKPGSKRILNEDLSRTTKYPVISADKIWFNNITALRSNQRKVNTFIHKISELPENWNSTLTDIQQWILLELLKLNGSTRLYLLQYLMYKSFFEKSQFKSVLTISEHSSNERSILDAARANGIYTVGIQHGVIGPNNISYNFLDSEAKYSPIPDSTIVWGKKWQEFLVNHSCYTLGNTHALGQLRTDLVNRYRTVTKEELSSFFPTDKKWVLFASQPQKDENLRKQAALDVIKAVKSEIDYFLIIKIHPAEDKKYYEELIRAERCKNCSVVAEEIDLYKLLATSDVVITCFSTVGGEAIYFDKPLITYDPLKEDIAHYHEYHIADQTTNLNELKTSIKNAVEKTTTRQVYYDEYIASYVNKVDGKTTKRYFDFINSL